MVGWSPHLRVVLKRKDLGQDVHHKLVLGNDPFFNALIDLSSEGTGPETRKTKMRRFPCIFCWEATEGRIGERKP
jgi:hypothetical protein